jgi:hypothetical protein
MGFSQVTRATLQLQALSVAQCEQMHTETAHEELKLHEGSQASARLRSRLGLSAQAPTRADRTQEAHSGKHRRPGHRLPIRDLVGQQEAKAIPA